MVLLVFLVAFGVAGFTTGSETYKGKEAWGYVNVRPDAYMFWWLYYKDVAEGYENYPLVIYLQGGPGMSSTGFGNFVEIGPYDKKMKPRNTTWVNKANVLFLDNPVGTGFSYVTNTSALARNNSQIAADLVTTLTSLMENIPEFQKTPLYMFGESYGGKMVADFAIQLLEAIKAGKIKCNFKGVAFGDSWISPYDSVSTWGQYLYAMSLVSRGEMDSIDSGASEIEKSLKNGKFVEAQQQFSDLQNTIETITNGVDFYNVLKFIPNTKGKEAARKEPSEQKLCALRHRLVGRLHDPLTDFMNGEIKEKLHVIPKNVTWSGQSSDVFNALEDEFMRPALNSVESLLNETSLNVVVYNGQFDLTTDVLGTTKWVEKVNWPGLKGYLKAQRKPVLLDDGTNGGFVQTFKNFKFFWILNAGHFMPIDAGEAGLKMLELILQKTK